jgi:hypothetical protein
MRLSDRINNQEIVEFFIGLWKTSEKEEQNSWMKQYRGRRLLMHMEVWAEDFWHEWGEEHSELKDMPVMDLTRYFEVNLSVMKRFKSMEEKVQMIQ